MAHITTDAGINNVFSRGSGEFTRLLILFAGTGGVSVVPRDSETTSGGVNVLIPPGGEPLFGWYWGPGSAGLRNAANDADVALDNRIIDEGSILPTFAHTNATDLFTELSETLSWQNNSSLTIAGAGTYFLHVVAGFEALNTNDYFTIAQSTSFTFGNTINALDTLNVTSLKITIT